MTASAATYISKGMAVEQANELASQINGTASVVDLIGIGFPVPLANELVAEIAAKTGDETALRGLGMPSDLAVQIDADMDAIP